MFNKIAAAHEILRRLHEKRAGWVAPVATGAALVGGAHVISKGIQKGREYQAGFQPGVMPGSNQ